MERAELRRTRAPTVWLPERTKLKDLRMGEGEMVTLVPAGRASADGQQEREGERMAGVQIREDTSISSGYGAPSGMEDAREEQEARRRRLADGIREHEGRHSQAGGGVCVRPREAQRRTAWKRAKEERWREAEELKARERARRAKVETQKQRVRERERREQQERERKEGVAPRPVRQGMTAEQVQEAADEHATEVAAARMAMASWSRSNKGWGWVAAWEREAWGEEAEQSMAKARAAEVREQADAFLRRMLAEGSAGDGASSAAVCGAGASTGAHECGKRRG